MAKTKSALDLINWARGARRQQPDIRTAEPEMPTAGDAAVAVDPHASHVFALSEFPVTVPGGRVLVHLRIRSVGGSGRLQIKGVDVEPGREITVGDLYAGDFAFESDGGEPGWFDYEAWDGQCYSGRARVTLGRDRRAELQQLPPLSGEAAEPESEPLESLMGTASDDAGKASVVAPEPEASAVAIQPVAESSNEREPAARGETRPAETPRPAQRPVSPGTFHTGRRSRLRRGRRDTRASKLARASAHRMRRRSKTQSRRSAMRRRRGADPE